MKRSRFLYLHPECNAGKIAALEALQSAYTSYLAQCVQTMIEHRRANTKLGERNGFFPESTQLSTNIVIACQGHAVEIVHGWVSSKYSTTLRAHIRKLFKDGCIDERTRSALCIIGKKLVHKVSKKITEDDLELYWSWLLDPDVVGRTPTVSDRCGMHMNAHTAVISQSDGLTQWWIAVSHLELGKRIQLPLVGNPHVKQIDQVSKGVLARKDKRGRWRFEVVERSDHQLPELDSSKLRIAIDVGLNCMIATSNGELLGTNIKPKFDRLYAKVRNLRANRQRQGLRENSPRLDRLESRLTGMVNTLAGRCTNQLVECYPGHVFVIEDLDLSGCRGQKRFAYRAVHHSLANKAQCLAVNPAYTSQPCPSCGYVSRNNRSGTKFHCRSCGRKAHADVVGAKNLLGRSEDKQIQSIEDYKEVGTVLRERYRQRRDSSLALRPALVSSSPILTVGRAAQDQIPSFMWEI